MSSTAYFRAFIFALLLAGGLPVVAQDRVAQLSRVTGAVKIRRAADGSIDQVRQRGPRVRNGSVFAGDEVNTAAGASAMVLFSDGSTVELKENTLLTIQPATSASPSTALTAAGGRRIKVLAGKVLAQVVPGGGLTEFETPSGVAAVRGTSLTVEVDDSGPP